MSENKFRENTRFERVLMELGACRPAIHRVSDLDGDFERVWDNPSLEAESRWRWFYGALAARTHRKWCNPKLCDSPDCLTCLGDHHPNCAVPFVYTFMSWPRWVQRVVIRAAVASFPLPEESNLNNDALPPGEEAASEAINRIVSENRPEPELGEE